MTKTIDNGDQDISLITMARESANAILRIKRAPSTTKGYLQIYRRLNAKDQTPAEYCQSLATSKGVYYTMKAGYQYGLASDLKTAINAWFGSKDFPKLQTLALVRVKELYAKLAACAPDYTRSHQHQDVKRGWEPVRKRKSKRQVLGGLPKNWRELVAKAARPQHRLAITVLAASGCRPAELAKGVYVARDADEIVITIPGAKVTSHSGQPHRFITFDPQENPFARMLFDQLQQGEEVIVKKNYWTLFDAIKSAVKRAGISERERVTPYCFRHQFAADVKADGICAAEALGHATDRTQSNYGARRQAKGSSGVKETQATRPVKKIEGRGANQDIHSRPRLR